MTGHSDAANRWGIEEVRGGEWHRFLVLSRRVDFILPALRGTLVALSTKYLPMKGRINGQRGNDCPQTRGRNTSIRRVVFESETQSTRLSPLYPRSACVGRIGLRVGAIRFLRRAGYRQSVRPAEAEKADDQNSPLTG